MKPLYCFFAVFAFFLTSLSGRAWDSSDFLEAVHQAQDNKKDILVLYTASDMSGAGVLWRDYLLENPAAERELGRQFILSHIVLPSKRAGGSLAGIRALRMASRHGISMLPTMILCDSSGKAYGRVLGGIRTKDEALPLVNRLKESSFLRDERDRALDAARKSNGERKEAFLLKAMGGVPLAAWGIDYPEVMKELGMLNSRSPLYLKAKEAEDARALDEKLSSFIIRASSSRDLNETESLLGELDMLLKDPSMRMETRQFLLLGGRYPLLVKKAKLHYNGVVTMDSEKAFDESVKVLEEVRDMDRESYWGREAHRIREDLRKARLSAAKFD